MDDGDIIIVCTFMNFILTLYRWNVKSRNAVHSTNVSNDFYK
jgi:hypothetical protein